MDFAALLDAAEDTKPEEIKIRTARDDPLLKFQAVDLRLDLPVAPFRRKSCADGGRIEANPLCHFAQFSKAALFSLDEPCVQILCSMLGQHHDKLLP